MESGKGHQTATGTVELKGKEWMTASEMGPRTEQPMESPKVYQTATATVDLTEWPTVSEMGPRTDQLMERLNPKELTKD